MPITINVQCTSHNGLKTDLVLLNGAEPHNGINAGHTTVDIETWLNMKAMYKGLVEGGTISVEPTEELSAIEAFKLNCFSEFEILGIPTVKAATLKGNLSTGVKNLFALEWIDLKEEIKTSKRDEREEENLSIARRALLAAEEANSIASKAQKDSVRANIIAIVSLVLATASTIIAAWVGVNFGN
ncbi:hypothetical protein [Pseudomonas sp. OTU750018]|uniref:hypothetical protein n=1 Tax=Pseudomonas sp. OTU750018 TaxID=2709708 RepID=UPI0014201802|nr:hypothetical protein [Pseudomonas sp. OTU750018]